MAEHKFTGFGFGPIQAGLFVKEAYQSGNFSRLVVGEVDNELVEAVRQNNGCYHINIARDDGIEHLKIEGVELLNPGDAEDRERLLESLAESTEIATCLPSVEFYTRGRDSIAGLIARAVAKSPATPRLIYTAENNNHAAEILSEAVSSVGEQEAVEYSRFLNTVIGKMSRVVRGRDEIRRLQLRPIVRGFERAFLVEEFNNILVTRANIPDFRPGIAVFVEKEDLLPFEEAKLYGHNAIHAMLAYLGSLKGHKKMIDLTDDPLIMDAARKAFINESGKALIRKYGRLGEDLFTENGYTEYADDLLRRITNPYLADTVERAGRDPLRKLAPADRIFGTMSLVLANGVRPRRIAMGALAAIAVLLRTAKQGQLPAEVNGRTWQDMSKSELGELLGWIWKCNSEAVDQRLVDYVYDARGAVAELLKVQ